MNHWMSPAVLDIRLRSLRMKPVCTLHLAPPGRGSHTSGCGKVLGRRPANTNDQSSRSASVTWPVARTKRSKSALETAQGSIQYDDVLTSRTGPSPSDG